MTNCVKSLKGVLQWLKAAAWFVLVAGLASPAVVRAQATASINGTVQDATGAVIPEATVVLHSNETNLDQTTVTNNVGAYLISQIHPGSYSLKVSKTGFRTEVQQNLTLDVNQTATVNIALSAGSAQETVEVKETTAEMETSTSELGEAVVQQQVTDLPLNSRNFTQILNLTPGVSKLNVSQNSTTSGGIWSNPVGTFSYPAVNGQTNRSNLFLMDGVNDEGSFGSTYAVAPIVDDIQEFKVQSHNDDASFGGVLGGVVNVATKSGTAQYGGTLWEFLRNTYFDAANPFVGYVTPYQQNQFGASLGGPLPIPGQGRQKTFFYLSAEGFRLHQAANTFYNTPTTAELGGDFSGLSTQIYNPYSGQPFLCDTSGNPEPVNSNNAQTAGTPCNILPPALIDQGMVTYAQKVFPAPNLTTNPNFNGLDTTKDITSQNEMNARLDHRFGDKDSMWARFTKFRQPVTGSGGFKGLDHVQNTDAYNLAVSYNRIFSGTSLLEAHFGRNYGNIKQGTTVAGVPNSFGSTVFNPYFAGNFKNSVEMIPEVVIQGYIGNPDPSAHGAAQVDQTNVSNIWEYGGDYTKILGHHTLRAGGDFNSNNAGALYLNSSVIFAAANTASPTLVGGNALASFVLGIPQSAGRRNVIETEHGGWVDGFYVMDQWKATSKLSFSLGGRYDITLMPIYGDNADNNNYVGDMDFNNGTYILERNAPSCATANAAPCIPGGTLPTNVVLGPSNGQIIQTDKTNFQLRTGAEYQLFRNTVVRGGYGRFYDNWAAVVQQAQNWEGTWPSLDQLGAADLNPTTSAPTVFASNPLSQTTTPPVTTGTPFGQETWFADPNLRRPYSDQWNFGIQQQVTSGSVLTVNYVGSVGKKLDIGGAANTREQPGPTPACGEINCGAQYPYIIATAYDRNQGHGNYQALQASFKGVGLHGLTYLLSYTWSKNLDLGCTGFFGVEGCSIQNPYNIQGDKGPASIDQPQIFSADWVYAIPFGKGHKLSSGNSAVDYVIGNWNLNGILSFSSGQPFDVGTGKDIANTGNFNYGNGYGYERLDPVSNKYYPSSKTVGEWFNTAAFTVPLQYNFGTLGRDSLRSATFKEVDLSIFKQFPITERVRLEFRFEAFNATNTPVYAVPGTDVDNGTFGVVPNIASGTEPRQLQFALKLYY